MSDKKQYWGKIKLIDYDALATDPKNRCIEWIGPMTKKQMRDEYDEYRHNSRDSEPVYDKRNVKAKQ